MIQWPSTCLASRTCTPHAGAHPDFFHTLKLVVLDLKSKPATENEAEPVKRLSCIEVRYSQAKMAPDTLCRRYGIKPFRYTRMHRQTVMVRVPTSFVQLTLWPEFAELSGALTAHLDEITLKIIKEEVHEATQDADEVSEPRRLR